MEGSHDAYLNSVLPDKDKQMVEHDFSRGPYWPSKTYDAVWSVEFLEHVSFCTWLLQELFVSVLASHPHIYYISASKVGRNFHKNYLPVFRKAAILFVTHSVRCKVCFRPGIGIWDPKL